MKIWANGFQERMEGKIRESMNTADSGGGYKGGDKFKLNWTKGENVEKLMKRARDPQRVLLRVATPVRTKWHPQ